ncbi:tRNA glutamyl-Q(34) synthetase GluQRS [Pelistega ratti]|uniref:tRNA glutamyl-Q(34) synthetase GluQRS n=1 Tax=Pelistega ratti TaxID=2652177 RepID=UPI00135ACFA1|nr:tRNA glutamyl-Q(34) synthetase GluQRS [Pelistega ratti]
MTSSNTYAPYIGRFAPSPSGPLHDGSLVAAMASYLDARANNGQWLLRIEDIDTPRVVKGADHIIMQQLQSLGMQWDQSPIWQSQRVSRYEACFVQLKEKGLVYGCACTRKEIADSAIAHQRHEQGQYPYMGTCRVGTNKPIRAWRLIMPDEYIHFEDRYVGLQQQHVQQEIGDIIIKRTDGLFAYQLVVVIDDHDQGVTHIVRGQDLLDSTQRQIVIANYFNFKPFKYLHIPLVLDNEGRKLSKQNHAPAICLDNALSSLEKAWLALGFASFKSHSVDHFWAQAILQWANRFGL